MNLGMNLAADKLEMDHDAIRALFDRFEQKPHRSIAMQLADELDQHAQMEDELVHPLLEQVAPERAATASRAHDELGSMAEEARNLSSRRDLIALTERMRAEFDQHVLHERDDLAVLADALGVSGMNDLGFKIGDWHRAKEREVDDLEELLELSRDELYERARTADVSGRSTMNKRELADALAG